MNPRYGSINGEEEESGTGFYRISGTGFQLSSIFEGPGDDVTISKGATKNVSDTDIWWEGLRDLGYKPRDYKDKKYRFVRESQFGMLQSLFIWRGSVWSAILMELIAWLILYTIVTLIYRLLLTQHQQQDFELLCEFVSWFLLNVISLPLGLVLGFYVTSVYQRWWEMWCTVPWPDKFALLVSGNVHDSPGVDAQLYRYTLVRYLNLTMALVCWNISSKMQGIYPNLSGLIKDGLMTKEEFSMIQKIRAEELPHNSWWWLPLVWCANLLEEAREKGCIRSERMLISINQELLAYRQSCAHMIDFQMVRFPLIYSQVVTFAVWSYFLLAIIGFAQYLIGDPDSEGREVSQQIDLYFPIFTVISFVVIAGWLKVAQKMLEPYADGEDDVRFDLHWVLHRNVEVATAMVVHGHKYHPPMRLTNPLTGSLAKKPNLPQTTQKERESGSAKNADLRKSHLNLMLEDVVMAPTPPQQQQAPPNPFKDW